MLWLANLRTGLHSLLRKHRVDQELNEELEGFIEASTTHKQRSGMNPAAARRAAHTEMGSLGSVKHQIWSSRWESTADGILQDVRLSLRTLAKSPGFTLVALLSLALGIGANTAIFTLIHQVLLRNLPVQNPEQLFTLGPSTGGGILGGIDLGAFDMFTWDFARQLEVSPGPFKGVAAYGSFSPKVSVRSADATDTSAPTSQVPASLVSGNYFAVLGATPLFGRTILPSDSDAPGRSPVVVLSEHYWQQALSADPAILGKSLSINGNPFRVIGVMPAPFHGIKQELEPPDLWTPITMEQQVLVQPDFLQPRSVYFLHLVARHNPASNLKQDQLWLDQQIRAYIRAGEGPIVAPERIQDIARTTIRLTPAAHGVSCLGQQYGGSLAILMVVVALVLLIACANLANFLLARAATRQREIATRLALGSSRGRIVRQSLIETLILSVTGGVLGLAIAFAATRSLIAFVAQGASYIALDPTPDLTVLLFTFAVSLFTGLLFGLGPALSSALSTARTGAVSSLSSSTRANTGGRSARLFPKILVTTQVMLSLLLLIGAGLFLRSLNNLQAQEFGFERTHLLLAEFSPKLVGYRPEQVPALHVNLLQRLEALPGVRSAALAESPPIGFGTWRSVIKVPGYVAQPKEDMSSVLNRVSPRYFETTGISLVAGRAITSDDSATSLKVAVVNEILARKFFPNGDAIGHSISLGIDTLAGPWQIVGIARDTRIGNPRDLAPPRMIYMPLTQMSGNDLYASTIELRTTGDAAKTIGDLRRAVAQIDPNLPLLQIHTIQEQVQSLMAHERLISSLTSIFSVLALLLASIGLYGVMNYSVVRRTSEIGIRLALGAQTQTVLWMILRESLILLALGLILGLPLTLASTHIIREQLFGLSPFDLATFLSAIAIVTTMTVFAAWLPARRATKVDPMEALRCD